jgi:uncharacterized membrane protein HdeD (DUF308 family)
MESVVSDRLVSVVTGRWWSFVLRGVAAILFGVLALAMPGPSLLALVLVWGAYAVVDGVLTLMLAVRRGRVGERWGWFLVEGIVSIAAGVLTFAWPAITGLVLLLVISIRAVVAGVAEVVAAIRLRKVIAHEWLLGASGVLSVAFGLILLVYPAAGALAVVWMIGSYAILFGVLLTGLGLRLQRWHRTGERHLPTGGLPTAT